MADNSLEQEMPEKQIIYIGGKKDKKGHRGTPSPIKRIAFFLLSVFVVAGLLFVIFKPFSRSPVENELLESNRVGAFAAYNSGNLKEAIPLLEESERAFPDDNRLKGYLASAYWLTGRSDDALSKYKEILNKNKKDDQTMFKMAVIYRQIGQTDKSLELLRQAQKVKPDNLTYVKELGKTFLVIGKYGQAVIQFKKAVSLTNDKTQLALIYGLLGDTYAKKGDKKKSRQAYKKGLDYEPGNRSLLSGLAGLDK